MNWSEMTPTERDVLVAEHVVGRPQRECPHPPTIFCSCPPWRAYTASMDRAWSVVRKMEEDGWGLTLYTRGAYTDEGLGSSKSRGCWFSRQIEGYRHEAGRLEYGEGEGMLLSEMICLTALRAKGVDV